MAGSSIRCRQPMVLCVCVADLFGMLLNQVTNTKAKRVVLLATFFMVVVWWSVGRNVDQVGRYVQFNPRAVVRRRTSAKVFVPNFDESIYMYSAIANYHYPNNGDINIVVTTLDGLGGSLDCCVLMDQKTLFITPAQEHFFYHTTMVPFIGRFLELFDPKIYYARQYSCSVPEIGQKASHVSLTSSVCSPDVKDYLPVIYPPKVPGGLAVCAKIAHSNGLDPEKVIEWFELQRILGVDKVLIFDMGNQDAISRVFNYYKELGILDLQPYELPGKPANRTLMEKDKRTPQFHHDESLVVLECRQRMAGYSYVMSHDLDEFIIPRRNQGLKEFFKEKLSEYQDAAGFFFYAEFFIYNWGPTNPESDLMLTRYRKATKPHWECTKYVYLPSRVLSSTTHSIFQFSPFSTYKIEAKDAVLHHYRRCPDDVWDTCFPETIIDNVMSRYTDLYNRVVRVRQAVNVEPHWNRSKSKYTLTQL